MLPNSYFHRSPRIGSSDISWSHAYQLRIEYSDQISCSTNF